MVSSKVSIRYALSLLSIALEKNMLDTVYNDVKLLINTFNESDELQRVIESPVVKPELKISILDEIFSGKIDKETINFIHFIIDKRREEILYSVAKKFIELRNEHLGIVELVVRTAFKLNDDQKVILKERSAKTTRADEIMTDKLVCVSPDNNIDECMAQMNENHVRHLPVIENNIVEGVITIMDVIKNILLEKEIAIEQLEDYIAGNA